MDIALLLSHLGGQSRIAGASGGSDGLPARGFSDTLAGLQGLHKPFGDAEVSDHPAPRHGSPGDPPRLTAMLQHLADAAGVGNDAPLPAADEGALAEISRRLQLIASTDGGVADRPDADLADKTWPHPPLRAESTDGNDDVSRLDMRAAFDGALSTLELTPRADSQPGMTAEAPRAETQRAETQHAQASETLRPLADQAQPAEAPRTETQRAEIQHAQASETLRPLADQAQPAEAPRAEAPRTETQRAETRHAQASETLRPLADRAQPADASAAPLGSALPTQNVSSITDTALNAPRDPALAASLTLTADAAGPRGLAQGVRVDPAPPLGQETLREGEARHSPQEFRSAPQAASQAASQAVPNMEHAPFDLAVRQAMTDASVRQGDVPLPAGEPRSDGRGEARLTAPLSSPAWPAQLGQQMVLLGQRGGEQRAELHLNPAELGPLTISLKVSEQGVQAQFLSLHASVRQAVEQAIPQLREALAEQGISLGDTSVGEQRQQHSGEQTAQGMAFAGAAAGREDDGEEMEAIGAAIGLDPAPLAEGRVDLYA